MQSSKQKAKHFREGFGEWVRITSDGQFKEKFDKWEKRRSSKKLRRANNDKKNMGSDVER